MTPGSLSTAPESALNRQRRRAFPMTALILLLLALIDLRVDLQLLADHITLTSLLEAVRSHPLAVAVLVFTPSLWRRYQR